MAKLTLLSVVSLALITQSVLGAVPEWGQCGGTGYTGDKTCASGLTCNVVNEWYHQCIRGGTGGGGGGGDTGGGGGGGGTTAWNPPSSLVTPLQQVWQHQQQTYNMNFKNFGYDQLIAARGTSNVCVRWEGSANLSESQRAAIAAAVKKGYKKWIDWLVGFDGFPYSSVPVNIVGYAVNNANQIQGSRTGIDVYTTKDSGGLPECDPRCGRFFNQNNDYSRCPGGAARRYDWSLWLTPGFGGGAGGDWGARMGQEYFMNAVNSENIHIFLHELGHYFALDDFYDWNPSNVGGFLMKAGSATQITDFDGWMMRDWWRNLKGRYALGVVQGREEANSTASYVESVAEEFTRVDKDL